MEESSSDSQSRCPCGFWGSAKTLGLCSICYRKAHRGQTQGTSHSFDGGKAAVGNCHNQSQNSSQGKRMDSKPFPSRSTTDNLASSLSAPPSERAALSASTSSSIDATTSTTSGTTTTPAHISTVMSGAVGGGDIGSSGTSMVKPSCEPLPDPSDTDTCSSASSDQSYDIKHDAGYCQSDSCSSLNSVVSSIAATYSSNTSLISAGDHMVVGSQVSSICGIQSSANDSKSSTQTSSSPSISGTSVDLNSKVASHKNSADRNKERGEKMTDSLLSNDKNSQASSSANNQPLSVTSGSIEKSSAVNSLSLTAHKGIKRSRDEMEASDNLLTTFAQKNKKRCFICSCKLELAQRTIGRCRCDRIFCALHRLPELHDCDFNHKEDGRREAREKMIKPTRHLGPSYRREDHL
ncbi:unnamed protein product [Lymnaea stagnalis]|uniref:Uncharacterized protein n=1 Tax=Lymnaea stagnalis TaxID=6523 RepID=A0AAV2ILH8_LYMST